MNQVCQGLNVKEIDDVIKLEILLGVRRKDKHGGKLIKNFRLSAKCLKVYEKNSGRYILRRN